MNFNEIKQQFSCVDVAQQLGIDIRQTNGGEWRGVSIAPGEHKTDNAFSVCADSWHDFSAGIGGSVLDLVAYVKYGSIDGRALIDAAKFLTGETCDTTYSFKYVSQRKEFLENVELAHKQLKENTQALDYVHSRKITDETIERFKLGLAYERLTVNGEYVAEWRLMCPYYDMSGNVIYAVSRCLSWAAHAESPKYHKLKQNEFLKNCLFGLNTLPRNDADCDTLILGEGLFDMLSAAQAGYPVLSAIGGEFSKEQYSTVIKQAKRFRRVVTVFDNDANMAGQAFTCKVGNAFIKESINFYCVVSYGDGHKDLSDYYTDGGDIAELLDSAINGFTFMSRFTFWERSRQTLKELKSYYPFYETSANEQAKALGAVKSFVRSLQKFLPDKDRQAVIDSLVSYYPAEKIAKFIQPPTTHELLCDMRDEFLDGRCVYFHGSIKGGSFYEYQTDGGYWTRKTDADIQSELSTFFRHNVANSMITQLSTMVRLMTTQAVMPEFNKKPLWLFQNGVFDLGCGTLREPKPDDNLTWQVNYSYDADATCPTFDKFLTECACTEPSRIEFLTDLLGYIPFADNRLDKIFILIGEGSNGKSTFCHVLKALVQSVNKSDNSQSVTSVQPSMFDKATELIQLKGSVLNVAFDIQPDLRGCESALKSVASGDSISGNYKFCDTEFFEPRCKLVLTSNKMIRVRDDSYGMRRRLMFCKFAHDFTGHEDTHMREKLLTELPGIFNKMYRSYLALLEREKEFGNRAIRPCCDQDDYMSEFKQSVKSAAAFWSECRENYISHETARETIYADYRAYCERNGRFAVNERQFFKDLRELATDEKIAITDTRHRTNNKICYFMTFIPSETTQETDETLKKLLAEGLELTD